MSYRELIDALRAEGEDAVRAIRRQAEAEADGIRTETVGKTEEMRGEQERVRHAVISDKADAVLAEAAGKARAAKLHAEAKLSDRLYDHARSSLPLLRDQGYENVFAALVRELPPSRWQVVRVNPADIGIARTYFPDSEIIPDAAITGGLEVMDQDGEIRVTNTFEKRCELAWQELLPELLKAAKKESSAHGDT
jgi:vacuolar-type H+-ATPase subunit E/Vma4